MVDLLTRPMLDAAEIPHPFGVKLVAVGALALIGGGIALDFWLELNGNQPIGFRVKTFATRYPGFMAALALVIGMMVGHFFFSLPSG